MYLSLDISNQTLHAVEGRWNGKQLEVVRTNSYTPEDGCLKDGQIVNRENLINAIKSLHSLMSTRTRKTIITISGSFIMTRDLDLPTVDRKKLTRMVKYEMNGSAGIARDLITEYITTGKYVNQEGQSMYRLRASAAPRETVMAFNQVLEDAGLKPVILDIHSNAVRKVLERETINDMPLSGRVSLLADLGENNTNLYVADGTTIVVSRTLPVGHLALYQAAGSKDGNAIKTPYESVDFAKDIISDNAIDGYEINEIGQDYLQSINEAIQRTIQFSLNKINNNNKADTVYIYNTGAMYPNLAQRLSVMTGLNIIPVKTIGSIRNPNEQNLTPYLNALGALIRT